MPDPTPYFTALGPLMLIGAAGVALRRSCAAQPSQTHISKTPPFGANS
ncbi:MAG: LPXTG cell wall anchor domain-containing protein [Octadecabacter sp.]